MTSTTRFGPLLLLPWLLAGCASTPSGPAARTTALVPAGAAAIDITPDEAIRLTGYGNRTEPSQSIRQRLWAKALAFGEGRRGSVLITADLIGVPAAVTEEVARRLASAGVSRAQLAISVTHTHTGPSIKGVLPHIFSSPATAAQQAVIDRYTTVLTDKFQRVALAALADRRPARLAWGQGRAAFAANRRVLKDGKWTTFGVTPGGAVDHDLPVLAVRAPDGALRAVLANYACHATTLEARENFLHGDWPGAAAEQIQARHAGVIALVTIGAGADSNPTPRGGGLPDVEGHGRMVADEVDRLLAATGQPITSAPTGRFRSIDLAFGPTPGRDEWEERAKKADPAGFQAKALLERLHGGGRVPATAAYPVQTWTFGRDLAMVFLGGEVVADYGLRLKRELDASRVWVNAYSNDVSFYVASRRMIPEGGYEVDRSMVYYGQPGAFAAGTEDQIIRTVHDLLRGGFKR